MKFSNPLAALVKDQRALKKLSFETQKDNEELKLILRKHFATNIPWMIFGVLLCSLPIVLDLIGPQTLQTLSLTHLNNILTTTERIFLTTVYLLVIFYYCFINFLAWYFDLLIVTNRRIIDINYLPPFYRQSTQAQLEEIQDVRHRQGGVFAIIFNYGDLFIQTAGTKQSISLQKIPQPGLVNDLIVELLP